MDPRNIVLGERRRMRTPRLGPSVELPMGPRNVALGGGNACEHRRWGSRWSSLWRQEALHWVGETQWNHAAGAFAGAT
eukprot:5156652-Pyramimonas_sp.AAC.1